MSYATWAFYSQSKCLFESLFCFSSMDVPDDGKGPLKFLNDKRLKPPHGRVQIRVRSTASIKIPLDVKERETISANVYCILVTFSRFMEYNDFVKVVCLLSEPKNFVRRGAKIEIRIRFEWSPSLKFARLWKYSLYMNGMTKM